MTLFRRGRLSGSLDSMTGRSLTGLMARSLPFLIMQPLPRLKLNDSVPALPSLPSHLNFACAVSCLGQLQHGTTTLLPSCRMVFLVQGKICGCALLFFVPLFLCYKNITVNIILHFYPLHSFQLYDADGFARSHYHLLQRANSNQTSYSSVSNNATQTSNTTAGGNITVPSSGVPGAPGRWRLPPDSMGLGSFAHMMHRIDTMSQVYTLYNFLQVHE